eukprot:365628-Chlamydomonas_euryale.AAC.1
MRFAPSIPAGKSAGNVKEGKRKEGKGKSVGVCPISLKADIWRLYGVQDGAAGAQRWCGPGAKMMRPGCKDGAARLQRWDGPGAKMRDAGGGAPATSHCGVGPSTKAAA